MSNMDVGWPVTDFRVYLDTKMREVGIKNDAELAAAAGVNASLLSRWRSGRAQPSRKSLKQVAPVLRVAPVMLYLAAGLDAAEDLDVNPDADAWPEQLHELRSLMERYDAAGHGDTARRDVTRLIAGWRSELNELEADGPNGRRRAG